MAEGMRANRPLVAGHRGAVGLEPENTMRGFRRAVALGVDEVELDVHVSADGGLVVIHDETVDRTTNGRGLVRAHTLAELERLDAGRGERIPRLRDVLDAFPQVGIQLEVKVPAAAAAVVGMLSERTDAARVTVTSFRPETLAVAACADRRWRLGLIVAPRTASSLEAVARLPLDRLLPHWDVLAHAVVGSFEPVALTVWPCNDEDSIRAAAGFGGITTDRPDLAVAVWGRMPAG